MKKLLTFVLLTLALGASTAAAEGITVNIEGKPLSFDAEPFIEDGTTFVPMRAIFEALGASIDWDNDTRTVTSVKDGNEISLTIDSDIATKNGITRIISKAPRISYDYTMVPLRFVCESLDCAVYWDGATQTIDITTENTLAGKSMLLFGDSVGYGANWYGGYGKIIGEEYDMTVTNKCRSSSVFTRNTKAVGAAEDEKRYRPCIVDAVDEANKEDDLYDYIIIEGGVNDYWSHTELGALTDGFNDEYNEETFAGALESVFSKLREKHPESVIGFVIIQDAFNYKGAEPYFEPYYEMMKSACEKWGVPCLDLYKQNNMEVGLNVKDPEVELKYFASEERPEGDGCHPNELGYRVIFVDPMVPWLKSL